MIATAKPWTPLHTDDSWSRTYFQRGRHCVRAEVVTDHQEGRIWWLVTAVTGRDRFGKDITTAIARGSYAIGRYAAAVAKRTASRLASAAAYAQATTYYKGALERALERVAAARALLDATDLTDYRTLAARQDNMEQLAAELEETRRHMLALAA